MRTLRIILITAGFISVLFLSPGTASARSRFYLGFGTSFGHHHSSFGHHYSSFGHGHYSHYGWHSGYYDWLDHGRYYGSFGGWSSSWYGTSTYMGGYWPVYAAPRVVITRRVVVGSRVIVEPKRSEYKPANAKLFAKVRNKRSELLKVLKIGDKPARIKAIAQLAGYSFDDNVRKALEEIILTDPDPELRMQVAESLSKVKNLNLIATLEKVKEQDADLQVREQAEKAIEKIKSY